MSPVPACLHLLLRLLLLLAASSTTSATSFACAKPSTCQPAIVYVVPSATTYEQLLSRFRPTTLHDLLAANKLPSDTTPKQAIPARTTLNIPFRCLCTGSGVGQSTLYTVIQPAGAANANANDNDDDDDDLDLEVVPANTINDQLMHAARARLPCSCDMVDGSNVVHLAYIVRTGDSTADIAARYRVPEPTLLRINNITKHTSIRRGQILDVPLQGMGTWSRVHYISRYRKRSLVPLPKLPEGVLPKTGEHFPGSSLDDAARTVDAMSKVKNEAKEKAYNVFIEVLRYVGFVIGGVLVLIILSWLFGTCYYWISALNSLLPGTTTGNIRFNYSNLDRATRRFSVESKIGGGFFGEVYNATYKGEEVAVKKLNAKGKTEEIHIELQTVAKMSHTNLVRLKGWCGRIRLIDATRWWKGAMKVELLIVFEWIPNGDLESHLYKREQVLPWEKRYKIVKGIGSALRYLHHQCNPCILHRDVKPANILLDDHFNAKLTDFGLSLITSKNIATVVTRSMGAEGYMDPLLRKDGDVEFNRKSDVYSFGIVLLEIACMVAVEDRTKNKRENPWRKSREEIWELYSRSAGPLVEDAADAKLGGVFDREQMERVVRLGLDCSHPDETQRPSMEDAMKVLEDGQEFASMEDAMKGEGGYSASCSVNGEDEAPMMPNGAGSSG